MKFILTIPPSVNATYRYGNGHVYKSLKVTEWTKEALQEIMVQKMKQPKIDPLKVNTIYVTMYLKSKRKRDGDNILKALLDCTKAAGLVKDDNQYTFIQVQKIPSTKDYCEVEIL